MRVPVYVASNSASWQRARDFAHRLQETGLVRITGRWFDAVEAWGVGRDHELTAEQQIEHAGADLVAVDQAAVFIALWGEAKSEGLGVELGYVLGKEGVVTVTVGPHAKRCIFAALRTVHADDDEAAFDHVIAIVRSMLPRELPGLVLGNERP